MDFQELEAFFFKAMLCGWAAGAEKTKIDGLPGYKAIKFRDADFSLTDGYFVSCADSAQPATSAGMTTIWHRDRIVWYMNYGGRYTKPASSFVKRALLVAYEKHEFIGGRGPRFYAAEGMRYWNQPRAADFYEFSGREEVFDDQGEHNVRIGYHEYFGAIAS